MKITINGAASLEATKQHLDKQLAKTKAIDDFCKVNKIKELNYRDTELEYSFTTTTKKVTGGAKDE